jgi:hypothetical protein
VTASRRFAAGYANALFMVRPPPISLRLRSAEITRSAHRLLRRLDADDLVRRRIRWQAQKALIAIHEMVSLAGPKTEKMSYSERKSWQAELNQAQAFLKKIKDRGV